jgi:probable selenium-dependent hydroxylase accessory protein YqeC
MPVIEASRLPEEFGLLTPRSVYLIGGGGKTTLMFALARAWAARGLTVLTTTSTRILHPRPEESERVIVQPDVRELIRQIRGELRIQMRDGIGPSSAVGSQAAGKYRGAPLRHLTAARASAEGGKLLGFGVEQLEAIEAAQVVEFLLVEADGSAGRSLKAHREYEPVVSPKASLVIAVVGIDCLGSPLDDAHVHRSAVFAARLGLSPGTPVTAADVAAILFHPEGYLKCAGAGTEVAVFISKVRDAGGEEAAAGLVEAIRTADRMRRIGRIVAGELV